MRFSLSKNKFVNTFFIVIVILGFIILANYIYQNLSEVYNYKQIKVDERFGYFDKEGTYHLKLKFNDVQSFSQGLAAVQVNTKWGYIDKKGQMVIKPQFENAGTFSDGISQVIIDNKLGFIDLKGRYVIKPSFDPSYFYFFNYKKNVGLIPVGKNGKWGYIDNKGKWKITPKFDYANFFSDGIAAVRIDNTIRIIDKSGKYISDIELFDYDNFYEFMDPYTLTLYFLNGYASFGIKNKFSEGLIGGRLDSKDRAVYLNKNGEIILSLDSLNFAGPFVEGVAVVCKMKECGYIDKTGKFLIEPQFYPPSNFSEGLAGVSDSCKWFDFLCFIRLSQKKFGYIDKTGKYIIPAKFDNVSNFNNGLAVVNKNSHWGYIYKNGNYFIKPQFVFAYPFSENIAAITLNIEQSESGFIVLKK